MVLKQESLFTMAKIQITMIKQSTKIKRGVEMLLNGQSVWANHDPGGDNVFVCVQKTQDVNKGDEFLWVVREDLKLARKIRAGISAKPKALTEAKKSFKQELNVFYASQILQIPERCENCNEKLNAYSSFAKRSVTAHILGKGQNDFPMVATHPMNRMFLGCGLFSDCSCHSLWDLSDAETRKQMKCYPIALERLEAFKSLIPARKQAKAEKYLGL